MRRNIRLAMALGAAGAMLGSCYRAQPALIKDATTGLGVFSICPSKERQADARPEGLSPEFDQRLREKFRAGTSEAHLTQALVVQGFDLQPSCPSDRSIRWAKWFQGGDQLPMEAIATWKVDQNDRLVWTRGYLGPGAQPAEEQPPGS